MTIKEKISSPDKLRHVRGSMPVQHIYTAGVALDPFFFRLRDKGVFTGTKCDKCKLVYVPPVAFCERCFSRLNVDEPVTVSDEGALESFTVSHMDCDGKPLREPAVFGLVRLNGASTTILHRILCAPDKASIGMKVRAKLLPRVRRTGAITDIEGFVPIKAK